MSHIFISYRSLEFEVATKLAAEIQKAGYRVWMDRLGGILPGDNWKSKIQEGVNESFAFIAILSREYVKSEWCRRELDRADDLNVPIFSMTLEEIPIKETPMTLQSKQYIKFGQWDTEEFFKSKVSELLDAVFKNTNHPKGAPIDPKQITAHHYYREDIEDKTAKRIADAKLIESYRERFKKIKVEAITEQMDLALEQLVLVNKQKNTTLNMSDRPILDRQKQDLETQLESLNLELENLQ